MNPALSLFLRLTAIVAAVIVALFILGFLVKVVVVAAIVAAIGVGGYFVYNLFRRRSKDLVIR